jgi:hypothetical protein
MVIGWEFSDGTATIAVCHSDIPLPLEVFYLFITGSKGLIGLFNLLIKI